MNLFRRPIVLAIFWFLVTFVVTYTFPWVVNSSTMIVLTVILVLSNDNARRFIVEMVVSFVIIVMALLGTSRFGLRLLDAIYYKFESFLNRTILLEIRKECCETDVKITEFDWDTIVAGTNNFADLQIVGRGKSGTTTIYSMALLEPSGEFAVKRFSPSSGVHGLSQFVNETFLLPKLEHPNIIKLIGYCVRGKEKLMVHEFMLPNSLDTLLQSSSVFKDRLKLIALHQWSVRFKLIIGIAEGVAYLHEYSGLRVVHRDLNLSNILLDESSMNPKISGFGSAGGLTVGGVMSPKHSLEMKTDMYCFGVIVLAMMSGKRVTTASYIASLIVFARTVKSRGTVLEMVQDTLGATHVPDEARKCLEVGVLCTQLDPDSRPTITSVLEILQGGN